MSDWTASEAKEFLSIIRSEAEKVYKEQSSRQSSICACLAIVIDSSDPDAIIVRLLSSPTNGSQDLSARNRSGSTLANGDSVWLHYWGDYTNAYIAVRNMGDIVDAITADSVGAVSYTGAQTLTAEQKLYACENIGAADSTLIAMTGNYGVFTGGAVTAQGTPNQTVAVSAGSIITPKGKRYAFNAVSALAATAADATNSRIDIVYVTSAGVVTYLAGTAAASPSQPATPSNGTILAAVYRAANDNTISTSDITGQRDFISTASDFEDVNRVTESSNAFACDFLRKHTKNFSFSITNTNAKTVTFSNVPYGTCDSVITIKATATASVTWTLDGRTLVWPAGAPTLTAGYTYDILFSYVPILAKWVGRAQLGAAN